MSVDADVVAVVVVRDGRLPAGAGEAVAEAAGAAVFVGTGSSRIDHGSTGASRAWWAEPATEGDPPAPLAGRLATALARTALVILPASPDGRDLAPWLAAASGRPLLAGCVHAGISGGRPYAELLRVDGRVVIPVATSGPAVATLWPGARSADPPVAAPQVAELTMGGGDGIEGEAPARSVVSLGLVEPDPATMDLADAPRVLAGGAGLVPPGADHDQARASFSLLTEVAAALGASAGATRVVTDAGWMSYDRQIGTTGVAVQPDLYVALGVSGASQHIGGIGDPRQVVSVNLDPSCPMTARADLGLVADGPRVLVELANRLGVPVPPELQEVPSA